MTTSSVASLRASRRVTSIGRLPARRPRSVALWFAVVSVSGSAAADPTEIQALRWLHSEAEAAETLTQRPSECSLVPEEADRAQSIRLGRIAFRSPVLLGGLASRMGLSCDGCHRNGHGHPGFFVAGVSGASGTVDVTGRLFSAQRDDRVFNPVPIPSLVDVSARSIFGTIVPDTDLARFVDTVVVDEFQGEPPTESIRDGLVAYLESLRAEACPADRRDRVRFESDADALRETLVAAVGALERDDREAAEFVLRSLRAALGRVYRRFPKAEPARRLLVDLSRSLGDVRKRFVLEGDVATAKVELLAWQEQLEESIARLGSAVKDSFYEVEVLRRAFATSD
jgi:hypothetical protein